MFYLAVIVLWAFVTLGPAINVTVARQDISAGIPASSIRRGYLIAFIVFVLFSLSAYLILPPILWFVRNGDAAIEHIGPNDVMAMFVGFLPLFEGMWIYGWGLWSVGPTLLMAYAYVRLTRGQSWCVDKVQREANDWNNKPWTRRLFYGFAFVVHAWVVIAAVVEFRNGPSLAEFLAIMDDYAQLSTT